MFPFSKNYVILVILVLVESMQIKSQNCGRKQDILQCAEKYGGKKFVDLVYITNASDFFLSPSRTLFLPTDEAMTAASGEINNLTKSGWLHDALRHHLVNDIIDLREKKNDDVLISNNAWQLRINMYQNQKKNSECANNTTISGSRVILQPKTRKGIQYRVMVINRFISQFPVGSIYDNVIKEDKYSIFELAASKAKFLDILKNESFTLFLPNNVAFSKLPSGTLSSLLSDPTKMTAVLQGHVVRTTYYSQGLQCLSGVNTLSNTTLSMTVNSGSYNVISGSNNISVVTADISTKNGVIHEISEVILPKGF